MSQGRSTNPAKPEPRIGSYRLLESLGSGGMSSVFRAEHVETGHEVAVKVLPRSLARNGTLLQRFLREAKSAEALEHPNIVAIYDRGVDQGRHYLVLEYVAGGDLHDRVKRLGPLPFAEAVAIVREAAKGLQFAASRGLIHRDIKPANLLMSPSGHVKIIDLGLALQAEAEDERVTREGTTVGTVDYMSPEQARDSRATSERSDMYSLGCTFYYLLTGYPPYPGGDVADKLSRHCLAPPPDPRKLRPEIPGPLAQLVMRMMAKRPERRFADYQELIDELDSVPTSDEAPDGGPLYALVDDDEGGGGPPEEMPGAEPLLALIDEDDDPGLSEDDERPQPPARHEPRGSGKDRAGPPAPREFSMAELASLSGEDAPASRPPAPRRPERAEVEDGPPSDAFLEEDSSEEPMGPSPAAGPRGGHDPSMRWVATVASIGLAVVLLVIGAHQLWRSAAATPDPLAGVGEGDDAPFSATPEPAPAVVASTLPKPAASPRAPAAKAETGTPPPAAPAWVEPADPLPTVEPEPPFGQGLEAKFVPDWAKAPIPARLGGPLSSARRVTDPRDPAQRPTLLLAMEAAIGGTVELADNGPFFERDLRIFGESCLIRARPGYRPVVCVATPQLDFIREQPAVFVLEGKSLVLDGLDLVVNVADLPLRQSALFLCRGGSLTLRDCTVTIVNPKERPFALVRFGASARPSRVRLETTLARGQAMPMFDLSGGSGEVFVGRSVVAGAGGPVVVASAEEAATDRRIGFVRSVVCGRGPILEVGGLRPGVRPAPAVVRALGSTFAQLAGAAPTSLVVATTDDQAPAELLQWSGEANAFQGWREWMSAGPGRVVKVGDLAAARTAWPGTDARSRERATRWTLAVDLLRLSPRDLMALDPDRRGTLTRVSAPQRHLIEQTVQRFRPPNVPPLADPAGPLAPDGGPRPAAAAGPGGAPASPVRELAFDLRASPWHGDLGLFLRDNLREGDRRICVRVEGGGPSTCTPVRLPDGVSLEVVPSVSRAAGSAPISWSPARGADAEALIDVRGGDLTLTDVRLSRDAGSRLGHLVRVEDGHLVLNRCWLTAPGVAEPEGGALVDFSAPGTRPRPDRPGPFSAPTDRPICRLVDTLLITGGDALRARVGRGLVALSNSAIAAGGSALRLVPAKVARARFDAALYLDRCTIAAERSFVLVASWPGTEPGPDRPWLVATRHSAFVAGYDRPSAAKESALLRVEPDALARGTVFWQSANDAYEVPHFTARTDAPPGSMRSPGVQRQWVEFWGERHVHNVTGPGRAGSGTLPSVRFYDRLRAGAVAPGDLELDPNHHPGRASLNVGADLRRLGIPPARPSPGR